MTETMELADKEVKTALINMGHVFKWNFQE